MQTISPDFTRMIELPGVGPCPRPVDIDQSVTGFADLVSLRIYSFAGPAPIDGEAEDDEVLIVLLSGSARISVTGANSADYALTIQGTRAIYLPPGHHYRLVPEGTADVAYMRAKPQATNPPQGFSAGADGLLIETYADRLQLRLVALQASQPLPVVTAAGENTERLVHMLAETNCATLAAWHTLALSPGETTQIEGHGHVLIVSAK